MIIFAVKSQNQFNILKIIFLLLKILFSYLNLYFYIIKYLESFKN